MSGPTIHQRVVGFLWHWATGPGWVRDGSEIAKLRADGMRVLKVQLQDDGPIPAEQAQEWRDAGMRVWGMAGHVDGDDPVDLARWLKLERTRLSLAGLDCNFESDVLRMDFESAGEWSEKFTAEARRLMPTLPMHLDSYWGPMGAGINLGAYKAAGFRFAVQTFWGAEGLWDDPPTNIVAKGLGAQPVIPKAIIKPIFRVAPNNSGQLPHWPGVFLDWMASGCKGGAFYYIDGSDFELVRWLTREAIRRGVAY